MTSAVIGQGVGLIAWPISLLIVCHTHQLEWVKSIDSTVSVHLSCLWCSAGSGGQWQCGSLNVASCFVVGAYEFFTHLIPAGDIVLSDIPQDVFLGGVRQHFAVCFICVIDVGGVGAGRASAAILMTLPKSTQLVMRNFHLRTDFPSVDWTNDGVMISDG